MCGCCELSSDDPWIESERHVWWFQALVERFASLIKRFQMCAFQMVSTLCALYAPVGIRRKIVVESGGGNRLAGIITRGDLLEAQEGRLPAGVIAMHSCICDCLIIGYPVHDRGCVHVFIFVNIIVRSSPLSHLSRRDVYVRRHFVCFQASLTTPQWLSVPGTQWYRRMYVNHNHVCLCTSTVKRLLKYKIMKSSANVKSSESTGPCRR